MSLEMIISNKSVEQQAPSSVIQPLSLRPKEAAKALGIGTRLLWEKTNSGEIPCVRIGRCVTYPVALLEQWLVEQASKSNNSKGGAL